MVIGQPFRTLPLHRLATQAKAEPAPPQPEDAVELSEAAPPATVLWKELTAAGLMAGPVSIPGAIGAAISETGRQALAGFVADLEAKEVYFYQTRKAEDPEQISYHLLSSEEAVERIEQGSVKELRVYEKYTSPYPLSDAGDLQLIDALYLSGPDSGAPEAEYAEAINSLKEKGHRVSIDHDSMAYEYPWDAGSPPPVMTPPRGSSAGVVGPNPLGAYRALLGRSTPGPAKLTPEDTFADQKLTRENAFALDFFHGSRIDRGLSEPALARSMREVADAGFTFSYHSKIGNYISTDRYRDFTTYRGMQKHPEETPWVYRKGEEGRPVFSFPVDRETLSDVGKVQALHRHVEEIWDDAYPTFSHLSGHARVVPYMTRRLMAEIPPAQREAAAEGITRLVADEAALPTKARQDLKELLDEGLDFLAELGPRLTGPEEVNQVVGMLGSKLDARPLRDRADLIRELMGGDRRPGEIRAEFTQRVTSTSSDIELEFEEDAIVVGGFELPADF